ncbi:methylated-DNA--[protein]-cysteine S-methyltransferase [Halopseudomonas laoshanensis]|uniref:Methylated-DNA--protein-cysteine methyltransferase n=1 Tax=Halopseudomonas laoshanensis TaxID=2268758 RepID=A0A7V7GX12_9GAMM|nr:methylated-DNA--[protein]-cysteine S-methyltransferase [Halopseudomonas laoshanensis]KAA0696540.1 methylated-DNA--[protein]-cysteine S-methyltransferase [Halopseudomonas laoshanensis]
MRFLLDTFATPVGQLFLVTDEQGRLRALDFEDYHARLIRLLDKHYGDYQLEPGPGSTPEPLRQALSAYFAGDLSALDSIQTETAGTAFQRAVWQALRDIPAGHTRSYGQLAVAIGRPSASRAVGLANGSNPVALVVPCHRVIGASGKLTGYGGGLWRKHWLLEHEARHSGATAAFALV